MSLSYFGFREVPQEKKEGMVQQVFSEVAVNYDLMNDLMSLGLHRKWKDELLKELRPGASLLDIAGGTGDIAKRFLDSANKTAVILDLNVSMLEAGKKKIIDENFPFIDQLNWVHGNAENLPFEDGVFDLCTISFGIRNVTNISKALKEAYRVLRPGGKFVCLEFSKVNLPIIAKFYDIYSMKLIPKLGSIVANNEEAYRYLVESIKKFPTPELFLAMIEEAGFKSAWYSRKTFGVVAVHVGYKI